MHNSPNETWGTRALGALILICIVGLGVALAGLFVVNFKVGEFLYGHQQNYRQKMTKIDDGRFVSLPTAAFFSFKNQLSLQNMVTKTSLAQFGNFRFPACLGKS